MRRVTRSQGVANHENLSRPSHPLLKNCASSATDIAVATGNKGPKNSPTYDIYEQGEYGYFSSNYSLSELTKNYMGMFRVDNKQKALIVTNEVDCCTRIEERYRYSHEYILTLFYSR